MIWFYSTLISIHFLLHNLDLLKPKQYSITEFFHWWMKSVINYKQKSNFWQLSHYLTYQVPYHKDAARGNFPDKGSDDKKFLPK